METNINYLLLQQQPEIILTIEKLGGKYSFTSLLSIEDQSLACEAVAGAHFLFPSQSSYDEMESVNVNWNDSDTCKRITNNLLSETKQSAIKKLKLFTYKTSPVEIEQALKIFFADIPSKEGHWLYIAQHWNPRAINRVIERMIKLEISGRVTIQNPAAYFTRLIKFREKRRDLLSIDANRKKSGTKI